MNSNTKISIVVPCYNQAEFLEECLQSVINQTYKNWECILIDDGSTDDTEAKAKSWTSKDERISYIFQNNNGLASARNTGIKHATGDWILPLDADDKISEDYLELAANKFNDGHKIIYAKAEFFGEKNGEWHLGKYNFEELFIKNFFFCTSFFKKSHWTSLNGYDENLKTGLEDWDFWLRLLERNDTVYQIPKVCFYYRIKEQSMLTELKKKDRMKKLVTQIQIKNINKLEKELGTINHLIKLKLKQDKIKPTASQKLIEKIKNIFR